MRYKRLLLIGACVGAFCSAQGINKLTKFYLKFDDEKIAITRKGLELSEMFLEWITMQPDNAKYFNKTTNEYVVPLTSLPAFARADSADIRRFAQVCDGVLKLDKIETLDLLPLIVLADFYRTTRVESMLLKPTKLKKIDGWERIDAIRTRKTIIKEGAIKKVLVHAPHRDLLSSLQQELAQRVIKDAARHYGDFVKGTGLLWTMIQRLPDHVLDELKDSIFVEHQTPVKLGVENHNIGVLALLKDGRLAVGLMDKEAMMIIDLNDYRKKPLEVPLSEYVWSFAVAPDYTLFVGLSDGAIEAWNTRDFKQKPVRWTAYSGHDRNDVLSLLLLPNNKLVSGSYYGVLKVWDPQHVARSLVEVNAHEKPLYALADISDDYFVSASSDAVVKVWDHDFFEKDQDGPKKQKSKHDQELEKREAYPIISNADVNVMVTVPDNRLAIGTKTGDVRIYDLLNLGKAPVTVNANGGYISALSLVTQKMLAVGDAAGCVSLWDIDNLTQKPITLPCGKNKAYVSSIVSAYHGFMIAGLSLPSQGFLDKQPREKNPLLLWDLLTDLSFEQAALVLAIREGKASPSILSDDRLATLFASLPDHEIQELKKVKGANFVQPKVVRATIARFLDNVEREFEQYTESKKIFKYYEKCSNTVDAFTRFLDNVEREFEQYTGSKKTFEYYEERLNTVGNLFSLLGAKLDNFSDPLITRYGTIYHKIKNDTDEIEKIKYLKRQADLVSEVRGGKSFESILSDDRLATLFASLPDDEIQELKKVKGANFVQPKVVRATIARFLDNVEREFKQHTGSQKTFEYYEERLNTVGNLFSLIGAKLDDFSDPLITRYSTIYHTIKNDTDNDTKNEKK